MEDPVKEFYHKKAATLVGALEHGDDEHRKWLREIAIPVIANALFEAYVDGKVSEITDVWKY